MTEEDAWQMIRAGASLVQVHTGLIYRGPGFVAAIKSHLIKRLSERGKGSIEDVIGEANQLPATENIEMPSSSPGTFRGDLKASSVEGPTQE